MDHNRWAATGEFQESMEVYLDETPWTVQEIRRWYSSHSGPTVQPRIVRAEIFQLGNSAGRSLCYLIVCHSVIVRADIYIISGAGMGPEVSPMQHMSQLSHGILQTTSLLSTFLILSLGLLSNRFKSVGRCGNIGETSKQVKVRVEEHRKNITQHHQPSLIYQHIAQEHHDMNWNVSILNKHQNTYSRKFLEACHTQPRSVNRSITLPTTYTTIIHITLGNFSPQDIIDEMHFRISI